MKAERWESMYTTPNLDNLIDDLIERMYENETYITIKVHKENFPNKISCRLINPSKSDIEKISKTILDKIITKIVSLTNVNQWKNSTSVIEWYKTIPNKDQYRYVIFDIENFYPLISLEFFHEALTSAKTLTDISETYVSIMMQARKTFLFNDSKPWLKKFGNEGFDVTMRCFDGAEVRELVGSLILTKLCDVLQRENVGLYRDDGLAIVKQMPDPELERKRKKIIEIFKKYGLAITIKTNLFVVNFLDIQFNLLNGTFKPYRKPNNDPIYVHKDSNHPPQVLKELPKTIGKQISTISSSREIFESSKIEYENALKISGYKDRLVYENSSVNENDKNEKKKRRESAILFGIIHHTQLM